MSPVPPAATLPRRPLGGSDLDFDALRAEGLARVQALSGTLWTDYNLHDPGVTLLEALCFALTELPYRAEAAVADLLCGPEDRIDFPRHGLHPPEVILPTRPLTAEDLRRHLLDRLPALEQVHLRHEGGLWEMAYHAHGGAPLARELEAAFRAVRNLGEDLAAPPRPIPIQPCILEAEFVLEGPRDPADVLADCFRVAAQVIADHPARTGLFMHLRQGLESGRTLEALLEGPAFTRAWIEPSEGSAETRLFFGDLGRRLQAVPGIAILHNLTLRLRDAAPVGTSIPWQGADARLQLHLPETAADLAGIRVRRQSTPAALPVDALLRRLRDMRSNGWALPPPPALGDARLALPQGKARPAPPYRTVADHLPPLYRTGGASDLLQVPGASTPGEAAQFTVYLALFDQWLAHAGAQCRMLPDLFAIEGDPERSYGWEILEDRHLPGIEALCRIPPERLQEEVFFREDPALERRGRVLDLILAMHGETCSQNRLRTFGWYFDPGAWARHLYDLKRRFALDLVRLTRDRSGAFDDSRPALDRWDNTPALQTRLSLLLGFEQPTSRTLLATWRQLGLRAARTPEHLRAFEGPGADWHDVAFREQGASAPTLPALLAWLQRFIPPLKDGVVNPAFLRCAVHRERYWCLPMDYGFQLFLGPDEAGGWWQAADVHDLEAGEEAPTAEGLAQGLRTFACRLMRASEGMHLVEHVLLRPPAGVAAPEVPETFLSHRLTAVFPGWTARGQAPAFRRLAGERLLQHSPAHLHATDAWLDLEAFEAFEVTYATWLEARRAYLQDPEAEAVAHRLEAASAPLRQMLGAPA